MFSIDGKTVLITGAGTGTRGAELGAGCARILAAQGALVLVNDLIPERAAATVESIVAAGGKAAPTPFDITKFAEVQRAVAEAERVFGPVQVLINNVGAPDQRRNMAFRDVDFTQPTQVYIDINLYGVMHCTRAVIDGMCDRSWGRVITVSSGAGQRPTPALTSLYGAGKAGAMSFMRQLAYEVGRYGITANTISWGRSLRRREDREDPETVRARMLESSPVPRFGTADDLAAACLYLASDEAGWVTGQVIGVNGGTIMTQ